MNNKGNKIYYVYLLKDDVGKTYTGLTVDLKRRLSEHNNGLSNYTKRSKGKWNLEWF